MELNKAIEIVKERYKTDTERIKGEIEVIQKYGSTFNPVNLDQLTAEGFKSFLLIKNNKHWEGIHRQGNMLTADMNHLIKVLRLLLDETKNINERLDKILPKNRQPLLKGLGRAVITPILLVVYPAKYAIYNSIVEEGMKEFRLYPEFKNESFSEKYLKINQIVNGLSKQSGLTLWQMDEVWWTGTRNKLPLEDKIIENASSIDNELEDNALPAEIESQLESLLISNWEKIPEFKNLEIIQEDGELIGQQYDTKEIGRIDLLCLNKNTGEYVVIELKKGRESDKVVGQTLRYIGWVMKNLAKDNQKVKGLIITFEDDKKLSYSLEPIKDLVQLKFYKISISIS